MQHRPQSFFSDQEIEAMLAPGSKLNPLLAALAIDGLRAWEAWVAQPCNQCQGCAWHRETPDGARVAAKYHARKTGHDVRVDVVDRTVYSSVTRSPGPPTGP